MQVTREPWFLRCQIDAAFHRSGMHKVFAQVRDMLQKQSVMTEGNVVEEYEMLMDLAHVADVRHDGDAEFAQSRLTARNSLTPATRTASG